MRAKVAFFFSGVLCAKGRWCIKLGFKTLNNTLFFFLSFLGQSHMLFKHNRACCLKTRVSFISREERLKKKKKKLKKTTTTKGDDDRRRGEKG